MSEKNNIHYSLANDGTDEEVIAETEAHFEVKNKSYKNGNGKVRKSL